MTRKGISIQELSERATAHGYKPGAHKEEDSIKDRRHYVPKTLRDQEHAIRRYHTWLEAFPQGHDLRLVEGLPPLELATIRDFLRFVAASGKGVIEERMTVESLNTFAEWFFAGFARKTGNMIDKGVRHAVYEWVRTVLRMESVVVKKNKPKYLFGETELVNFNTTFWTVDESYFVHPRNKAQIPFIIAVYCWTGARIGAFFPNRDNKDKAGLRYRDVEMVLIRVQTGWKLIYRIDQRWVKNNSDPENTVFGASTSQHGKLLYDDTQFLLVLAIADKAIYGIDSVEDFWELEIPPNEKELPLRWNDEVQSLPILRKATMHDGVTQEPLSRGTFDKIFKDILKLSGYYGHPTVHAIRRALGKELNGRYSDVQLAQHLTQRDQRVYGQSYVANTSSVDGKSAFLHEKTQHDHVEYFQSFAKFREPGLATKLPAEEAAAVKRNPQFLKIKDQVAQLENGNASPKEIKAAKAQLQNLHTCLLKRSLKQYQIEWVRKRRDWKVITRGKELPNDVKKTDLSKILCSIMPEYGRLTKTMISSTIVSQEERKEAVKDLYTLVSRDCSTLYRPGEEPVDGICPVMGCGQELKTLLGPRRNNHIHNCRLKELALSLQRQECELNYCFTCYNWFVEEDWDRHCQLHLASITSKCCATITYCHTLFRPAFCPFCLGDTQPTASASSRWKTWVREAQLKEHLQGHLTKARWPDVCPHPLCTVHLDDEMSFLCHLENVHDLKMPRQKKDLLTEMIAPDITSHKRTTQDWPEEDQPSPKRAKECLASSENQGQGSIELSSKSLDKELEIPSARSPNTTSSCFDLPELTRSERTSPTESDKQIINEMDTLFRHYLRSRSSSCSHKLGPEGCNSTATLDGREDVPATVNPGETLLSADSIDAVNGSTAPEKVTLQVTKPRITLRLTQPQNQAKPKPRLRLSQPKPQRRQKSSRRK